MCKFSNMNRKQLVAECRNYCLGTPRYPMVTRDCMDAEPYVVHVLSRDVLMVFGGRLTEPTYVKKIVADGDLNPKTRKNGKVSKVKSYGISLAPAMASGLLRFNNCTGAVWGCIVNCLFNTGRGGSDVVRNSRIARTVAMVLCPDWFDNKLRRELDKIVAKQADGETVGVRPNMFSDNMWERTGIIDDYPTITFYDYTKIASRAGWLRPNYYVTYSYKGTTQSLQAAQRILDEKIASVSVVFYEDDGKCGRHAHEQRLPQTVTINGKEYRVLDGTTTDWRPDDEMGVVYGLMLLSLKKEKRQEMIDSGFAVRVPKGATNVVLAA